MSPISNITGNATERVFCARVLGKYDVEYFRCCETGYIQTEEPYWLSEAYMSSMNLSDTGVLARNWRVSGLLRGVMRAFFGPADYFLDYAGGYGVLTRMMRDAGFDYYWDDPYTQNLLARGFEHKPGERTYAALSAIEVFEHLVCPRNELVKLLALAPNIFFTTLLLPRPTPAPAEWWYYATEHGQHVSFYTIEALDFLARANGRILVSNGVDVHLFLEPTQLPIEVDGIWLSKWLRGKGGPVVGAILSSYTLFSGGGRDLRWSRRVQYRLRGIKVGTYSRKESMDRDNDAVLRDSGFARDYAKFLLGGGTVDNARLTSKFPSKTEGDSKALLARMLTKQELESK